MAELGGIYKCEICGNVVSVIEAGVGALVCCGEEMKLFQENPPEKEGKEKHVPVIEKEGDKIIVKVGSVPHPMEGGHYIELIQLMKDGKVIAEKRLYPGEEPVAEFCGIAGDVKAREYCNIHGLWVSP